MATMLFMALPPCAYAMPQSVEAPDSAATDSTAALRPDIIVSLLTCDPGRDIYELEGHTALRIRIGDADRTFNWGLFDFNAPNFVYRFVKGETDYMAGECPTDLFLDFYRADGRQVTEQVLNLTDGEAAALLRAVGENLKPANRVYRYNYVKDNCSTRPLALIRRCSSDSLALGAVDASIGGPQPTFRSIMRHYHRNYPWYQFGIDLALGSGIDYPLSHGEEAFAPVVLREMLQKSRLGGRPLVTDGSVIVTGVDRTAAPTPWYLTPMAAACALLVICSVITLADLRRRRVCRLFDALLYGLFGLTGCVIAYLVFVSSHEATSPNLLILWLNPLCLLVPLLVWWRSCRRFLIWWQFLNFAAIIAMIVLMPVLKQSWNMAFIPLVACDLMRSMSFIHITRWQLKRNPYQIRYSGSYSYR